MEEREKISIQDFTVLAFAFSGVAILVMGLFMLFFGMEVKTYTPIVPSFIALLVAISYAIIRMKHEREDEENRGL